MEELSEQELEQLKRLTLIRNQLQIILKSHLLLALIAFVLLLAGILTCLYLRVTLSSSRYVARISMHYYPKQPGKIPPFQENFMYQQFNRPALRTQFFNAVNTGEFDGLTPTGAVMVKVEKKKNSSFAVVVHARSEREAVAYTNGYAQLCLDDYIKKRTEVLQNWGEGLKEKKHDVFRQIQEINLEKEKLTAPHHIVSPEEDYERLRVALAERREALAKLKFSRINLQNRWKRLQESLKKINPMLLEQKQAIQEQLEELKRLEKEIAHAQELYTDENPKLKGLLAREKLQRARFNTFLKTCGLTEKDILMLETAENLNTEMKNLQAELDSKDEEIQVLESEIAVERKIIEGITAMLPRYRELVQHSMSLKDSLQKLDEELADINHLLVLVRDDLFISEQAVDAVAQKPFRKKNLAIAVFAAAALSGFLVVIVVLLDLLFGNVTSEREMTLRSELTYLGKLPVSEKMFRSSAAKDLIFNAVCLHLQNALEDMHVVLAGALPGAKLLPEFFSAVEWTYAMSGKKILFIDVILADNIDDDTPVSSDTGIVAYSGNKGVLPIASKKYIAPTEQELLRQDLVVLRKKYDIIIFRHSFSFRHDRLFLDRFIPLCDSMLVAIGLAKTPRKNLRLLADIQQKSHVKIMTVLTDGNAQHFKKIMDMENES